MGVCMNRPALSGIFPAQRRACGVLARALILGLAAAGTAHADITSIDLGITAGYDSNAPHAPNASDRMSDSVREASLSATRSTVIDAQSGMTLSGALGYANHQRFSALDNATARLEAAYTIQPVAGYSSPWYEVAISAEKLKFADSRIRDGTIAAASVAVGKNLTDRIQLKAGAGYEKRWAAHENVYDLKWRKAFLDIAYQLQKNTAYARFTRIWGDQVFSARPGPAAYNAKAAEDDEAFGGAFYAYRMAAATNILDLGLAVPVTESDSIVAGAARYLTRAEGGRNYENSQIRISWLHRFY
jgi:hypothetical protein